MKKNKLAFIVVASFLALSSVVGCDANTPSKQSSKGEDNSVLPSSDNGGDQSQGGGNQSQGGGNTSQGGGNTSQGGGNTSQGGGNTSQGGGNTDKTDWSDTEKATMGRVLHGLILPFVDMDVSVTVSQSSGAVKIESQENMASGFLASYKAKFDADPEWVGEDISSEYGVYPGNAFAYQKPVTENGKKYYVAVMFTGLQFTPGVEEPTISKEGKFYLEAMDPYVYEFPAAFIGQWLKASFNSDIVPPAFTAEFYSLDEEGVLYGYSETNIEASYKSALEASNNFTVDANKNADGFYVAHPSDGSYVLLFKYDTTNKVMVLAVSAPKGWNAQAINAILANNHVEQFSLGSISNPNIRFSATEQEYAQATYLFVNVDNVTLQDVQEYINSLKTLGYKVADDNVVVESNQYFTTFNVITNEGMYTAYVTYSTANGAKNLNITLNLAPNPYVVKDWPAASVARYLLAEHDTVPAFAGQAYGFNFSVKNTYNNVVVILDNGAESAAKDAYIATLTSAENGYTAHGTLGGQPAFLSPNSEILVAVGCDPTSFPGEINILIQNYTVVETPWPVEDIANAIAGFYNADSITDTIPGLNVDDATSCTVSTNYVNEFRIDVDGLAASINNYKEVFKDNGWVEDIYYNYDYTLTGGLISPNRQLVACFDTVGNDLSIYVKPYYQPSFTVAGLGGNWNYNQSLVFFESADKAEEIANGDYIKQYKAEFDVNANDEFKITNGVDWYGFNALEANNKFVAGEGDRDPNIKALEKGSVTLYFKIKENNVVSIYIAFEADSSGSGSGEQPQLTPWPKTELAEFFGDDVDSIPEIKIDGASFSLLGTDEQEGMKVASIMVSVDDAVNKMNAAIEDLENQFNYSYDSTLKCYVSSNEGLPYFAFSTSDGVNNAFGVSIFYMEINLNEYTWSNALTAINEHYDGANYQIPDLEVAGATLYYFDPDEEALVVMFGEGENLDAKVFALYYAISELSINEKAYHYSKLFDAYVNVEQGLVFSVVKEDENTVVVKFKEVDLSETGFGIVYINGDDVDYETGTYTGIENEYRQFVIYGLVLEEGMKIYAYDFDNEIDFYVSIDNYSFGNNNKTGEECIIGDYLEYDDVNKVYIVKQNVEVDVYIKVKLNEDCLYIGIVPQEP